MWLVGVALGTVGAVAIAAIIWWERAAFRRLKPKPRLRQLETRLSFDFGPTAKGLRQAAEAMRRMPSFIHVRCRSVMVPELAGPPDILCSACGDTLERNGDHFDCTGCGRQVRP